MCMREISCFQSEGPRQIWNSPRPFLPCFLNLFLSLFSQLQWWTVLIDTWLKWNVGNYDKLVNLDVEAAGIQFYRFLKGKYRGLDWDRLSPATLIGTLLKIGKHIAWYFPKFQLSSLGERDSSLWSTLSTQWTCCK